MIGLGQVPTTVPKSAVEIAAKAVRQNCADFTGTVAMYWNAQGTLQDVIPERPDVSPTPEQSACIKKTLVGAPALQQPAKPEGYTAAFTLYAGGEMDVTGAKLPTEDEEAKKKRMMIWGGIAGVVVLGGVILYATRKKGRRR